MGVDGSVVEVPAAGVPRRLEDRDCDDQREQGGDELPAFARAPIVGMPVPIGDEADDEAGGEGE